MPEMTETRQMPMQTLDAVFLAQSANADRRTIDVQFYSGATVERYNFWTDKTYFLRFEVTEQACDLSRLNKGAPLLNSHNSYSISSILGVVEKAWLEGGKGMATVRFSQRPEVEPFWQDVKSGVIRNISMGANTSKYTVDENGPDGKELWTATKWQPMEISLVSVPADADARTQLSANQPLYPCLLQRLHRASSQQEDKTMTEQNLSQTETKPAAPQTQPAAGTAPAGAQDSLAASLQAERERVAHILKSVRALNLDQKLADEMIQNGVTLEAAKERLFNLAVEAGEAAKIRPSAPVQNLSAPEIDPNLPLDQRCKAEWERSADLRAEFGGDFASYLAFQKYESAGLINRKSVA